MAFVSDSPWLHLCAFALNRKSFEALMHLYYFKRRYFRYNYATAAYLLVRYGVFFVAAFAMQAALHSLQTYATDTVIHAYDTVPLLALWLAREGVLKLRYKRIAPYCKREHVLFVLAMVVQVDDYNVVRLISEFMGPEDLAEYTVDEQSDDLERHFVHAPVPIWTH